MQSPSLSTAEAAQSPESFNFIQLDSASIDAVLELEQAVLDALPEEDKAFIVPKTREQIAKNIAPPNFAVGVLDAEGKLVGVAFLLHLEKDGPLNGLTDCGFTADIMKDAETAGSIGTVLVHPDFRKKGLMTGMLGLLIEEAKKRHYGFLVAEVVPKNAASHNGFMHYGFKVAGKGIDPSDGTPLEFLKYDIPAPALDAAPQRGAFAPLIFNPTPGF